MRALDRKLWRDVRRLWSQMAAVALVMASGMALFVSMRSMHGYLRERQAAYYSDYRFANVFAPLKRAPRSVGDRLAELPGVERIETRVVADVLLDVPGLEEPATGRLVSLPETGDPVLNQLHLRAGRLPEPGRPDEAVASAAFAAANGLSPGDAVVALLNGRRERLRLVGLAVSPEYIYEIRGGTDVFPDNRRFGVLWMREAGLAAAFDLTGAFNDVSLLRAPGASEPELLAQLDGLLARYGGLGAYGRDEQVSHRFVTDEIAETQVTSVILPAIFLGVTAFLLNLVLSRLVATEREQIGLFKAFGYGPVPIAAHYLKLALVPVGTGAILGMAGGLWFAYALAGIYARFFQFPDVAFHPDWRIVAAAFLLSGTAAIVGALSAVRRVVRLPPAEAMRPAAPVSYRRGLLERLGLGRLVGPPGRMVLRGLERHPLKAGLSILGLALAVGICLVSRFAFDAVDHLKVIQFHQVQREDIAVGFVTPRSASAWYDLRRLPGVMLAEPFRIVPVRFRHGHLNRRTAILGLTQGGELHRIVDREGRLIRLREDGLLLGAALARRLDVGLGDRITVEVLEGRRQVLTLPVAGVADELIGVMAYADAGYLHRLLGESETLSGAFLRVTDDSMAALHTRLKALPAVSSVSLRRAALEGFERTIAESFAISLSVTVTFACIIAFGVVYNSARIALSERARELASLRVLGFARGQVAGMLLGEQGLLTLVAVPAGLLIGYGLCALLVTRFTSDLYRLPLVLRAVSYAFAVAVVGVSAVVSGLAVRRRLNRIDLIAVLKTRE